MALKDEENSANTIPCSLMLTEEKIYVCHDEQENTLIRLLDSIKLDYVTKVSVDPDCLYYCVLVCQLPNRNFSSIRFFLSILDVRTRKSRIQNLDFLFFVFERNDSIRSNTSKCFIKNFSSKKNR